MFGFLGEVLIGAIIAGVAIVVLETIKGGGCGGGIIRPGSQRDKDLNKQVKGMLSKGTHSSKEELQEWWDTYHPPK